MTLEEAVRAQLVSSPGLAALIGNRAYPLTLSENATLPALTYQRISNPPVQHRGRAGGGAASGSKTSRVRFQIDGWALSNEQRIALRQQIRAAMIGWKRDSAPRVDRTFLKDDRDLREASNGRLRASIDFELWAEES